MSVYTAVLAGFGGQEIMIIGVVVLLLFGATRVPMFMRGLGLGIKEFKHAVKDEDAAEPDKDAAAKKPDA